MCVRYDQYNMFTVLPIINVHMSIEYGRYNVGSVGRNLSDYAITSMSAAVDVGRHVITV